MKFRIPAGELRAMAELCLLVAQKRNTIPILSYVLIHASEDKLSMIASNLEQWIARTVKLQCDRPGRATVPAGQLAALAGALGPEEIVEIYREIFGEVVLKAGDFSAKIESLDPEDFPMPVKIKPGHSFILPELALRHMLNTVSHAISTEETRYYLNGVYFEDKRVGDQNMLRVVATDGHRLTYAQTTCPEKASGLGHVILPRAAVKILTTCLGSQAAIIKFQIEEGLRAEFDMSNGVTLSTKLIDGSFPEYDRVIPTAHPFKVAIDRDRFLGAIKRVGAVSSERTQPVKLAFSAGKVCVSCRYPDANAEFGETLPCDWFSEPIEIGFQARYVATLLERLSEGSTVELKFDKGEPAMFTDAANDSTLFILMPMKL